MIVRPAQYQDIVEESIQDLRDKGYNISEPNEILVLDNDSPFYNSFTETPVINPNNLHEDGEGLLEELIHMEQDRRRKGSRNSLADDLVTWLRDATYQQNDINERFLEPSLSVIAGCGLRFRGDDFTETINQFEHRRSSEEIIGELINLPEISALNYLEKRLEGPSAYVDGLGEMLAKCGNLAESGELESTRPPVGDRKVNQLSSSRRWESYGPHHEYLANEMSKLIRLYHRGDFEDDELGVEAVNAGFRYLENEENPRESLGRILNEHGEMDINTEELL